ncbi:hypothetical protein TI04_01790 [Achromatium sp. WMS2]|nr:hypothetical protein TI04_01790 [Achromatium sp. WMS2]
MDTNSTEILAITDALADLDQRIKTLKLSIWLGGEPTFTDRFAQTAEWIGEAIGGNKELKARALAAGLLAAFPGGLILRTIGRQYPGEPTPRWNLGILAHRNGDLLWNGPPDPVLVQDSSDRQPDLDLLRATIANNLQEQGWITQYTNSSTVPGTRLLARSDGEPIISEKLQSTPVNSPSIHSIPIPDTGLCDALAEHGYYLLKFHLQQQDTNYWPTIELPSINDPYQYQILLGAIADAARSLKLTALILQGYPPPTSRHWHWSTVTPDPAVIEISLTPTASLVELFNICTQLFAAADTCGLAPYRLHYNGRETDSGGGGQLTIGGPTPEASPFFAEPRLLPRLIRALIANCCNNSTSTCSKTILPIS